MMEAPVTEPTATEVSAEAASHKGEFFLIDAGLLSNGGVPGIEIANEDKLIDPGMNVISCHFQLKTRLHIKKRDSPH